jgi:hypothetical protein
MMSFTVGAVHAHEMSLTTFRCVGSGAFTASGAVQMAVGMLAIEVYRSGSRGMRFLSTVMVARALALLTVHLMKRVTRLLAALGALSIAGGALVFVIDPGGSLKSAGFDARAAIKACTDGVEPPTGSAAEDSLYVPYTRPCLSAAWEAAITTGSIAAFVTELEAIVAVTPRMEVPCHDEAHSAGIRAHATGGNPVELLVAGVSQRSVCDNGFVHGLIGALARTDGSPATVARIMTACDRISEPGRGSCVHGSGHAVWTVTRSMIGATELCSTYPLQTDRRLCMSGVLMTVMSPSHDPAEEPAIGSIAEAVSQVPVMCAESDATSLLGEEWLLECYQPLGEYFINHVSSRNLSLDELAGRATDGVVMCSTLNEDHKFYCEYGIYLVTFRFLSDLVGVPSARAIEVVCGPLATSTTTARACSVAHSSRYLTGDHRSAESARPSLRS